MVAESDDANLQSTNLQAPCLLIAAPALDDGFFAHSVVLLLEHGEDGTGGIVLNRPAPLDLNTLLQAAGLGRGAGAAQPVWIGGPVTPHAGLVLYRDEGQKRYEHDVEVVPGLRLSASMSLLREVAEGHGPRQFGLFLGRAGWGPGQLEKEMAEGTWITAEPNLDLLFANDADQVWSRALAGIGIDSHHLMRDHVEA
ncbi:MAG: YqgE/AlgH family protein [Deltaproteobacteria bacterium]|nr:YqgE/AlgH family protein [Deltaproteobacteria bacterium]